MSTPPDRPGSFTDEAARAAWSEGAPAWDEFVESGADYYRREVHGPGLLDACGPVRGLAVLDLGCGQGYLSRELARRGAAVAGVDLSDEMVRLAGEHEARAPLGIRYLVIGAAEVSGHFGPARFDLVTACMSLQDMADVAGVLRAAFAVLKPGGRMVCSVPHPATETPLREWERDAEGRKVALKVDRYFESGPAVCEWNMPRLRSHWSTPYWRHTLEEWSTLVAGAGFLVRRLAEPRPTPQQVRRNPDLDDCARVPYFLVLDLLRPAGSAP